MDKLPCDVIVTFFDDNEKFVWETESCTDEGSLISECAKVYETFGDDLHWEIGLVALCRGHGRDALDKAIDGLSVKTDNIGIAST
jgi:hypothetical protein